MEGKDTDDLRNEFCWEVLCFGYMEEVVCNGDDIILNPLFNCEPMKGLELWGDVRMFGSASNSTCKSILNMLI